MSCKLTPRSKTLPSRGASTPVATRSSVVLPDPFGPIRPTNSPSRTSISTPSKTVFLPYAAVTF